MQVSDRLTRRSALAAKLSALSDGQVLQLMDTGTGRQAGIGGDTRTVEFDGSPLFIKALRVSDRELAAGPGDTRNLFDLPPWYHYGVGEGSTGFNAWREVATHEMVSDWVANGDCEAFPLHYHWRILPDMDRRELVESDIVRAVNFWADSAEVEARLRALSAATTVVAVFMEHVPFTLHGWLDHQRGYGAGGMVRPVEDITSELLGAAKLMRARGLVHFDTHLDNVLTTGHRLVVSDFGLAAAAHFQLDEAERHFLTTHTDHDVAYCAAQLTNAILGKFMDFPDARARKAWLESCSCGDVTEGMPSQFAKILQLLAPTTAVVNDFYWRLHDGDFDAPFPAAALAATLDAIDR